MDEVSSHVCLVLPSTDGKAARKIVPPRLRIPYWKGLGADSEEKHEPVSDIDTVVVDSLKALDPKRPIREADITLRTRYVRFVPQADMVALQLITSSGVASVSSFRAIVPMARPALPNRRPVGSPRPGPMPIIVQAAMMTSRANEDAPRSRGARRVSCLALEPLCQGLSSILPTLVGLASRARASYRTGITGNNRPERRTMSTAMRSQAPTS